MAEYADRNHMALGDHYVRHVSAMTAEGLHRKSDIAAELAWRDAEIERLRAQVAALSAPAPAPAEPVAHVGNSEFEGWLSTYSAAGKGHKQLLRDAYAAGMSDPDAAPAAPAGWQPIETAPRDGSLLMLWEAFEDEPFIGHWLGFRSRWAASTTHYDTDGNACVTDRVYSDGVTHWMPIPAAPGAPQGDA